MKKEGRCRLDEMVVKEGLAPSRSLAQAYIMEGKILVNGINSTKPGTKVSNEALITMEGPSLPYVSRGGIKLEHALKIFNIAVQDKTALDGGASTGGFTDCFLQHGAKKVYAVDVGHNQIALKLHNDPRVIILEDVNLRYLNPLIIKDPIDIITLDLSFISLEKIWPALLPLIKSDTVVLPLIKPQFEAGPTQVKKGGRVIDPLVHKEVLNKVIEEAVKFRLYTHNITYSPIKGPAGNIEFFLLLSTTKADFNALAAIKTVVETAHKQLSKEGIIMIPDVRSVGKTNSLQALGVPKDLSTPQKNFETRKRAAMTGDIATFKACVDSETQDTDLQEILKGTKQPSASYYSTHRILSVVPEGENLVTLVTGISPSSTYTLETLHKVGDNWLLLYQF